jgi:hypothetical protein
MEEYWKHRSQGPVDSTTKHAGVDGDEPSSDDDDELDHEFAHYRQSLVSGSGNEEGWAAELRRYLNDMPANVNKDMDLVSYWQVHKIIHLLTYMRN